MISNNFTAATTSLDQHFLQAPTVFNDSIASLCWTSQAHSSSLLACTSWDSQVAIYCGFEDYSPEEEEDSIRELNVSSGEVPCLCVNWIQPRHSPNLLLGDIGGTVWTQDITTGTRIQFGKHDDAVKNIYDWGSRIISLSYDKTMKFWDLRSPDPVNSFPLGAQVVCSDLLDSTLAIGLSNKKLLIFHLDDFSTVLGNVDSFSIDSPLGQSSQLSSISISKENVVGIGTYDGRSNLSNIQRMSDETTKLSNIVTFKAHKIDLGQDGNTSDLKILYPIHAVGLHPQNKKTYFTAGGDGTIIFWDIALKNKLSTLSLHPTPITAAKMSPDGKFLAYGVGYDWAKGIEGSKSIKTSLNFHFMQPADVVPE